MKKTFSGLSIRKISQKVFMVKKLQFLFQSASLSGFCMEICLSYDVVDTLGCKYLYFHAFLKSQII